MPGLPARHHPTLTRTGRADPGPRGARSELAGRHVPDGTRTGPAARDSRRQH